MTDELANFGGLIDTRTLALWVTVTPEGVADMHAADGMSRENAARYLRLLADQIDPSSPVVDVPEGDQP